MVQVRYDVIYNSILCKWSDIWKFQQNLILNIIWIRHAGLGHVLGLEPLDGREVSLLPNSDESKKKSIPWKSVLLLSAIQSFWNGIFGHSLAVIMVIYPLFLYFILSFKSNLSKNNRNSAWILFLRMFSIYLVSSEIDVSFCNFLITKSM